MDSCPAQDRWEKLSLKRIMEKTNRKIIVEIEEDAYQQLVNEIGRKRVLDNMEGMIDEFVLVIIKKIYCGIGHVHIYKRKPGQRRLKV